MEASHDLRESVARCLNALKMAKTDSERFAALLVIAQVEKNLKLTQIERKAVYGSLDLNFIKRLLISKKEPEGCEKGTLKSLGLTILSCMINEIEEANESQEVLDLVPRLVEIIYDFNGSCGGESHTNDNVEQDVLDNCFKILLIIASSEDGCHRFMQSWSLKSNYALTSENCIKILRIIVNSTAVLTQNALAGFKEPLKELFSKTAFLFSSSNDQDKFTLLDLIFELVSKNAEKEILNHASEELITELKFLRRGLLDIMQSKVDKKYRHMALKLISELIELFGIAWTCMSCPDEDEKYCKKFLHLLVSLTSVEVKMFFYDKSEDTLLMSYLFAILEKSIESISSSTDNVVESQLGENMAARIFQTVSGAVKEVVFFIDEAKECLQLIDACQNLKTIACVRLMCAYMSEETQALEKEIVKVAPYIIALGKESFQLHKDALLKDVKSRPAVIFMFLLPVLCHWSADDKTRAIIIEADLHSALWEFLSMLVTSKRKCNHETIETLTGIFTNIAITEPNLASDPKTIFGPMLQLIVETLGDYLVEHTQLLMSMVTLGLILARAQMHLQSKIADSSTMFFKHCLSAFCRTCPFLHVEDQFDMTHWQHTSELWFVGLDNFIVCISGSKQLRNLLKEDPIAVQMRQFVQRTRGDKSSDVEQIVVVLQKLLTVLGKKP